MMISQAEVAFQAKEGQSSAKGPIGKGQCHFAFVLSLLLCLNKSIPQQDQMLSSIPLKSSDQSLFRFLKGLP